MEMDNRPAVAPQPQATRKFSSSPKTVGLKREERRKRSAPAGSYVLFLLACLAAVTGMSAPSLSAQTFAPIPALSFTMPAGGTNPLPQVLTAASTGTNFAYNAVASTTSGGSWLSLDRGFGCCTTTPSEVTAVVTAPAGLAAGTYTGQIVFTANSDATKKITVPVSLVVAATTTAFFDNLPGQVSFSLQSGGLAPPSQSFQIRNGGTGTLSWSIAKTYGSGANWLTVSATSGSGASTIVLTVNPANLPGAGLTGGSFIAQLAIQSSGSKVTIPVVVVVGDSVFRQANSLNFSKPFGGANPEPQLLTVSSTGAQFSFAARVVTSKGGNWLQITPNSFGCCTATPQGITVTVNPDVALAAGTYTAEIIVTPDTLASAMTVPVTLTINPTNTAFFDDLPGSMSFFMETGGSAPPGQVMQIRNAGTGTLSWTLGGSTSDGGNWLTVSASSGTAPSTVTVKVAPENLPGNGQAPGSYTAQLILQTTTGRVTVPVSLVVGDSVFRQVNPVNFTKLYAGGNPLPQVITIASTGSDFAFNAVVANSTGGNWLTISPASFGCCTATPQTIALSVNAPASLAAGTYTASVIVKSNDGTLAMTVPVTLTISPTTAAFFDDLPGQLSFSMVTKGTAPPAQTLQIRNAGGGTLSWTGSVTTADGGNWLSLSASSGTAPSFITVKITPGSLPGLGLTPGNFTGQVVLQTSTSRVTIPVSVTVGDSVFQQANALNFTKPFGGANPLPQVLPLLTTGANFQVSATSVTAKGGNWLTISPSSYGCCSSTPLVVTVGVNADAALAAGTYTGEVIVLAGGKTSMTVPVTLTVEPTAATFFDDLPGQLGFSFKTGGTAPPAQTLQIRNGGTGTLNWTLSSSTSDGGKWISVTSASGTAPSTSTVSIVTKSLPGGGLVAGTYSGQIVLSTGQDRVTVPVTVVLGDNVFQQASPLGFSKAFGGADPAAQTLNITSTGTAITFSAIADNGKGGSWLKISPSSFGCCTTTPKAITVSVAAPAALAAGIYTGEVLVLSNSNTMAQTIPVTLTVAGTNHVATPVFTPPGGSYTATQAVVITDSTPGSSIFYTTDGTTPTTSSKVYSAPISVTASETLKAISVAPGYLQSSTATAVYTLTAPKAGTPGVTQTIAISEATQGATVYYTTDGTTPTTSSRVYTGPLTLTSSSVLKFIAVAPNFSQSAVRTVTTTVQ
jgi:hypothetical protein